MACGCKKTKIEDQTAAAANQAAREAVRAFRNNTSQTATNEPVEDAEPAEQ